MDKIDEETRSGIKSNRNIANVFQLRLILDRGKKNEEHGEYEGGLLNLNDPNVHNNVVMNAYTTTESDEGIDAQEEFHKDVAHIMNKVKYDYQKEQRRNYWWNKVKNFILPGIKQPDIKIPDKPVNPHAYKPGMALTIPFWKKTFAYYADRKIGTTEQKAIAEQYKPVETTNPFS